MPVSHDDDVPGPADPDAAGPRRTNRRTGRRGLVLGGLATAAALAAGAALFPLLSDGGEPSAAAPTGTPVAYDTEAPLPPAPEVAFYAQDGPPAGSPLEPVQPWTVQVAGRTTGTVLPENLVGLSLEATDLADPALSGENAQMVQALQGLGKPLLRFGGNAVDRRFFWTSADEPVPATLTGDEAHPVRAVTPQDLARVATLLEAVDGRVALTVDLGTYDPARAADMARHAAEAFGSRLVGITVGNEPNGYAKTGLRGADYGVEQYLQELRAYATAIHEVAPEVPIIGPGTYSESWWGPFAAADLPQQKILSLHHYPLSVCDGKADPQGEPVMANLINPVIHDRAQDYRTQALAPGRENGLATWITETGQSACPGSNETTKTHASALWAADYALSGAELGIGALSFHSSLITCQGGPPMSAICTGGPYLQPNGEVDRRANYYGLSMVAEIQPGDFLVTEADGGGLAYAYSVRHSDGSISVALINQNDPQTAAQTQVTLQLPGRALAGTMTQMTGAAFSSEDTTTIDGGRTEPVPAAERLSVPGFAYGEMTQTFPLTAGTVTVLHYTLN